MKRLMVVGLLVTAISGVAYVASADEVYWDFSVPDDAVTDKDFSHDYGVALPSQGEGQVYDQNQTPDVESLPEQAPIRTRTPDASNRVAPSVQPAEPARPSRAIAPRQPETSRRPATVTNPKPAETAPGAAPTGLETPERSGGPQGLDANLRKAGPSDGAEALSQKPTTRRMKWGQVDVKPSEPKAQPQSEIPQAIE